MSGACAANATDDHGINNNQSDGEYNVAWDEAIANIVPERVHDLERYQWGDYHTVFHTSRKWFLLGDPGRDRLASIGEQAAQLQEARLARDGVHRG